MKTLVLPCLFNAVHESSERLSLIILLMKQIALDHSKQNTPYTGNCKNLTYSIVQYTVPFNSHINYLIIESVKSIGKSYTRVIGNCLNILTNKSWYSNNLRSKIYYKNLETTEITNTVRKKISYSGRPYNCVKITFYTQIFYLKYLLSYTVKE